jgi:hypothetical protein
MNHPSIQLILNQWEVIGQLNKSDKLTFLPGFIVERDPYTPTRCLSRKLGYNNQDATQINLQVLVYFTSFACNSSIESVALDRIFKTPWTEFKKAEKKEYESHKKILQSLRCHLSFGIQGLNNLACTYNMGSTGFPGVNREIKDLILLVDTKLREVEQQEQQGQQEQQEQLQPLIRSLPIPIQTRKGVNKRVDAFASGSHNSDNSNSESASSSMSSSSSSSSSDFMKTTFLHPMVSTSIGTTNEGEII